MIACFCGGTIEFLYLLALPLVWFFTNLFNKIKYKSYVNYKSKHLNCKCDCHKDEL